MAKKKKAEQEDTEREDLDAFEEFEAGDEDFDAELEADLEDDEDEELVDDLDVPGLEEPPAKAAPKAAPKAKGKAAAKAKPPKEMTEEEFAESLVDLAPDVPVNLVAVIGKATTNVGDLMQTRAGSVIDLGRPPGETVDLVANGRLIARGELVEMDGQLGVRILKMVK
jgi:flagellar motor switch protein FliN